MNEESQVERVHTLRGGHDSAEMARRATRSREANMAKQVAENRAKLMTLAPEAIDTLGAVLKGDARPNLAPTAFGILDRTGNGPTNKTEVTVGPSDRLVQLIERLDAEPADSDHRTLGNAASDAEQEPHEPTHRLELPPAGTPVSVISQHRSEA